MKKQIIFSGILLISSNAFCMDNTAEGKMRAIFNSLDENKVGAMLNALPQLIASYTQLLDHANNQLQEEQKFDPIVILSSFSTKSKELQSALKRCSYLQSAIDD